MFSDQQRRELHLEPAELENLQFTVLDLDELKQLHSIAKRPPVRSLLSRQIANLAPKSMQKEVLPSDIDQLASSNLCVPKQEATEITEIASSNLCVPKQEATEIAEKQTVPFGIEILATISSEIIESKNNQVMREENSSLHIQLAERDSNRKRKEIEKSESSKIKKLPKLTNTKSPLIINQSSCKSTQEESNEGSLQRSSEPVPERNKRLEENCNESNSGVAPKKFPSRSARRKYAQRQLKKEMKRQARELQSMPRNGGDTTMNEIPHLVPSRHQPPTNMDFVQCRTGVDTVCLERLHQTSNPVRIECEPHYTTMVEIPDLVPSRHQPPTNMDFVQYRTGVDTVWPERLHQTSSRDRLLAHYLAPSSLNEAVNANRGNATGGRSNASISRGWIGRR
ncbi:hypothetical protein FCM35_KLT02763 [Carex littledalei]|uniref:Uncharacterized protein n=1 Tax=Carex littledalei TaxID=544730 RepID=A0A833R3C8_9POAL|nr:hypothetical protein FCM35_KLT02763 [Carex littledalei]